MEEGVGALYASYRTTILMNAPFAFHFTTYTTYEAVKRGLLVEVPSESEDDEKEETLVVHATAGATAGALAAGVTTSLDVVKTQLPCQGVCGTDEKLDSKNDVPCSSCCYLLGIYQKLLPPSQWTKCSFLNL